MQCGLRGCSGEYEAKTVMHTVQQRGQVVVIGDVPAEVCSDCGDVLLRPEAVRSIEKLLSEMKEPATGAPTYEFG